MNDENTLLDEKLTSFWLKDEKDESLKTELKIGFTESLIAMKSITAYSIISALAEYLRERAVFNPNDSELDFILDRIQELSEDETEGLIKAILHINRGQNLFTLKPGNDYKSRSKDARLVLDGSPLSFWITNNQNPLISEIMSIWGDNLYKLMPVDGYILIHWLAKQVFESHDNSNYFNQHDTAVCNFAYTAQASTILWTLKAIIHRRKYEKHGGLPDGLEPHYYLWDGDRERYLKAVAALGDEHYVKTIGLTSVMSLEEAISVYNRHKKEG